MTYFLAALIFVGGMTLWTIWIWRIASQSAKQNDIVHTERGRIETKK